MDALRLDEDGAIDSKALESELQSALQFDIKYRQQDNMKKRAVKQAPSYDDFKNMVACAHLKKVSRDEVESLSNPKKGWQKGPVGKDASSIASILQNEQRMAEQAVGGVASSAVQIKTSAVRLPKTTLELSRDLRRCATDTEKVTFLASVGLKKTKAILKKDIDADFLEELMRISTSEAAVVQEAACKTGAKEGGEGENVTHVTEDVSEPEVERDGEEITIKFNRFKWIKALTAVKSFGLLIKFATKDVVDSAKAVLTNHVDQEAAQEILARF